MSDDTHPDDDAVEADIRSFALHGEHPDTDQPDRTGEDCHLHVTITLELPGGWGTNTLPLTAAIDVIDRLERDGLRPYRTTVEITEKPTP
jgi:hypothetical protein